VRFVMLMKRVVVSIALASALLPATPSVAAADGTVPATGPRAAFDGAAVQRVLDAVDLHSCAPGAAWTDVNATLTIEPTGRVWLVSLGTLPDVGEDAQTCVTSRLLAVAVPPFKGGVVVVRNTFRR
jgi:hypothetical protein